MRLVSLLSLLVLSLAACDQVAQAPNPEVQGVAPEPCTRSWPLVKSSPSYSRNAKVVQYLLNEATLYPGGDLTADGYFGPKTYKEVVTFQRNHNLKDDGVVGKNTWRLLVGNNPVTKGDYGEGVMAVQTLVGASVDGIFGPLTEAAVKSFQRYKGLSASGQVNVNTWAALVGGEGCP